MPVAKIFYGELRSNEETDQTRPQAQVSWRRNISCLIETAFRAFWRRYDTKTGSHKRNVNISQNVYTSKLLLLAQRLLCVMYLKFESDNGNVSARQSIWNNFYPKASLRIYTAFTLPQIFMPPFSETINIGDIILVLKFWSLENNLIPKFKALLLFSSTQSPGEKRYSH